MWPAIQDVWWVIQNASNERYDFGCVIAGVSPVMFVLLVGLLTVAAYFLGCFNGAVIVSKYILRDDVRNHGSGNAGLTNFYRTFGGPLTLVVILCDVLKMVLSVLLGAAVWRYVGMTYVGSAPEIVEGFSVLGKYWAGLWCILGHMYPCMFHFKGGKGVLSGGTLAIMIDWRVALVVWGGFIVLAVLTKYVSLGSVWAGFTFPIATGFVYRDLLLILLAIVPGWLLVWKHRGNIKRLLNGTESKFSFHHKKDS